MTVRETVENVTRCPFLRSEGVHGYSERAKKWQIYEKSGEIRYFLRIFVF